MRSVAQHANNVSHQLFGDIRTKSATVRTPCPPTVCLAAAKNVAKVGSLVVTAANFGFQVGNHVG